MKVFKFALVLRLVSTLSYETSFQIRYKLNTFTNPNLKIKNSLSFSVSYILAIMIMIIIVIVILKKRADLKICLVWIMLKDLEISTSLGKLLHHFDAL